VQSYGKTCHVSLLCTSIRSTTSAHSFQKCSIPVLKRYVVCIIQGISIEHNASHWAPISMRSDCLWGFVTYVTNILCTNSVHNRFIVFVVPLLCKNAGVYTHMKLHSMEIKCHSICYFSSHLFQCLLLYFHFSLLLCRYSLTYYASVYLVVTYFAGPSHYPCQLHNCQQNT